MRVLALCKYGRMGASSRLRTMQYGEHLRAAGVEVVVESLLDNSYLESKYAGRAPFNLVASAYVTRAVRLLRRARSFDLIHLEKEAFPWLPWALESVALPSSVPLSLDLDDAIFHLYDSHKRRAVRMVLGPKIDQIMRRAALVTAGSRYIQERARAAGARRVEYVPTVVDASRYVPTSVESKAFITVGWIGSPSTSKYLRLVAEPLAQLVDRHNVRCVAVGADPVQLVGTPFQAVGWSESSEAELVSSFDIGIMPLKDTPWEQGKCAYKIIQYMAAGIPVVASPVGMNIEVLGRARCGSMAESGEQWLLQLERLIKDPQLRANYGRRGRAAVEEFYSVHAQAPRLAALWREVTSSGNSSRLEIDNEPT